MAYVNELTSVIQEKDYCFVSKFNGYVLIGFSTDIILVKVKDKKRDREIERETER